MIVWEGAALNNIDRITTVDNFARLHFVVRGLADLHRGGAKAPQVPWRHRGEGLKDRMIVWEGAALDNIDRTIAVNNFATCLLYTSPSPRDRTRSRMPSSA